MLGRSRRLRRLSGRKRQTSPRPRRRRTHPPCAAIRRCTIREAKTASFSALSHVGCNSVSSESSAGKPGPSLRPRQTPSSPSRTAAQSSPMVDTMFEHWKAVRLRVGGHDRPLPPQGPWESALNATPPEVTSNDGIPPPRARGHRASRCKSGSRPEADSFRVISTAFSPHAEWPDHA